MLIGLDTTFLRERRVQTINLLGREVSLVIGTDATFIKKGSVLANRAGNFVY